MNKYVLISSLALSFGLSSVAFAKKKQDDGRSSRCSFIGGIYFYDTGTCEGDWDSNDNVIPRGDSGNGGGKGGSGGGKGGSGGGKGGSGGGKGK